VPKDGSTDAILSANHRIINDDVDLYECPSKHMHSDKPPAATGRPHK